MRRTITFALFTTLFAASFAQDPDPKVTYATTAKPVREAVQEIAKLTGAKIDVAPRAAKEVVVLSLKDVPLSEFMTRLAVATSGEWTKDSEGKNWLNYSSAAMSKEAEAERTARTAAVTAGIKKLLDAMKTEAGGQATAGVSSGGGGGGMMFAMSGASNSPAGKAIVRLIQKLSPESLASIGSNERVVFSTSPTRMQRGLGNVQSIVADMVKEHNAGVEKAKADKAREGEGKTIEQQKAEKQMQESFGGLFGIGQDEKPITAAPAKVLLIASRGGVLSGFGMLGDSISLQLKVYDANGAKILTGMQSLSLGGDGMDFVQAMTNPEKAPPPPTGKEIQLSDIAKEFALFANFNPMAGSLDKKPSDELLKRLARPDLYDPLSYAESEGMLGVAKEKGLNLVACVPDSVVSMMNSFSPKTKVTVDSVLTELQSGRSTTAGISGTWLVVRPAHPIESRRLRLDRQALSNLIVSAIERELPTLEDYAKYATKNESPMETPVAMPYLVYFATQTVSQGMRGMTSWDMLRLYGALPEPQRAMLQQGGRLPFQGLTPGQSEQVRKMAFGANTRLIVEGVDDKPKEEGGFFDMIASFMPKPSKDYKDEPTEVMPNGLPGQGFLDLRGLNDTLAMPVGMNDRNQRMFGTLGADEIAMLKYISEAPEFAQVSGMMPKMEKMRLGSRRELNFTFHVASDVVFKQSLLDDRITKDAPVMGMDNLPADFKARIAKRLEALKKTPWPMFPGMGGPPPPL